MSDPIPSSVSTLAPLAPADISARKRPLAVLFVFAAGLAWALLVASPVHAWAGRVWGAHPDGDGVLFAPGGRQLLIWLGQTDAALPVTARTTLLLLLVGAVLLQLPLGALLASLAFSRTAPVPAPAILDPDTDLDAKPDGDEPKPRLRSPRVNTALQVGVAAFLPLCGLLALGTVAAIVVIGLGAIASSAVDHGLAERMGDARAFTLRLVTFALFLAIAAVIGVIVDLARAAVGRETGLTAARGTSSPAWSVMLRGVRSALSVARRGLLRATLAWAWRAAIGVAMLIAGYYVAQLLGGRGGSSLTILFLVHQLIVLGRTAMRASWLAHAIALVAPVQDAREQGMTKE